MLSKNLALVLNKLPFVLIYPSKELKDEYIQRYKNRGNDENFIKIRNAILVTVDEHFYNLDPKLIEKTVYSSGSGKFINEYRALFFYIFSIKHPFSGPYELTYIINSNGRITYLEARGIFNRTDKQVFDRDLLKRFIVTKQKIKQNYGYQL